MGSTLNERISPLGANAMPYFISTKKKKKKESKMSATVMKMKDIKSSPAELEYALPLQTV